MNGEMVPVGHQNYQQAPAVWTPTNCGMPTTQELAVYQTWAKNAAESQMYRTVGKEAGIMMIMLAAREYGIGPAQALNGGLHIIEGKVELSARVMSGLIRRNKHTMKILESTDEKCVIYGKRADTNEEHTVTYTIAQAHKAGLIKDKGGWKRNPEDMLFARAISRLARQLFSDCIGVGYIEGEISDSRGVSDVSTGIPDLSYDTPDLETRIQDLKMQIHEVLSPESPDLIDEFIGAVAGHYKWTTEDTLVEFLKDHQQTITKYHLWKSKRK